jgi:hypothetical protein
LIQKKKEAVKRTQAWRMCIKLSKSQTMPNTLHENDSHEGNRTNEDNISRTSILKWKQVIMNGTVSRREFVFIENVNRNRPETISRFLHIFESTLCFINMCNFCYINTDWSLSLFQSHHHKIPRCV